jgi:NADH:ubiquinone oxidoreductase subunit 4 (subunit M)
LAGLLLKLASYGIFRFLVGTFFIIYIDLVFFFLNLGLFGLLFSAFIAFSQIDIKKIIAYSSVSHMNFSFFGFFSQNLLGLFGSFFMMLSHAFSSSALFLSIGSLYDRYKTRLIFYYGGLIVFMPIFGVFYFFFIAANFGLPGTFNFSSEFFIIAGGLNISIFFILLSLSGLVLGLAYSIILYNRIFFGLLKFFFIRYFCDCIRLEFFIFFIFN